MNRKIKNKLMLRVLKEIQNLSVDLGTPVYEIEEGWARFDFVKGG